MPAFNNAFSIPRTISRFVLSSSSSLGVPRTALFSFTRPSSSAVQLYSHNLDWVPPLRVSCIADEILDHRSCGCGARVCSCDKHHWLAVMQASGLEFATEQALFNHYIMTLASVVGSEEEAKKKIYLVSCGWRFGFGTEIDEETKYKLEVCPGIAVVVKDHGYDARDKDPEVQPVVQFIPINWDHRLDDIFSYHHLSKCNSKEKPNHWLINIKEPRGGFVSEKQTIEFCADMLAAVFGSSVTEAKGKIYIVWCKWPFGFGAEIEGKALDKLRALPDVLAVLPDNACDVKNEDSGVLVISPCTRSQTRLRFLSKYLVDEYSEDDEIPEYLADYEDSDDSKYDEAYGDPYCTCWEDPVRESCCQHWYITMEKPDVGFISVQLMIDYYINTLTRVVGSEKEAKGRIYRITCEENLFGFGAEIDKKTSNKLKGVPGVRAVCPELFFRMDHKGEPLLADDGTIEGDEVFLGKFRLDLRDWKVNAYSNKQIL